MGSCYRCALTLIFFLLGVAFAKSSLAESEGDVCRCPDCPFERTFKQSRWFVIETKNFRVSCDESRSHAENLARHAEALLLELRPKWLGKTKEAPWKPKCEIYLHRQKASYLAAVGRGAGQTVGSSLVKNDGPTITSRRLDLLGGRSDYLSAALPHELTHIVLKDKFVETSLPRWADEGTAILSDTASKQERHRSEVRSGAASGRTFIAAELLALEDYPRPEQFGVFYGQSASLTEYLVSRESPAAFINFIEKARSSGYDSALKSVYGIENVGELDRLWRRILLASSP